ncbi:hypothetical protein CFSAN002369_15800 [Clostridium botulinum CFSAN002369]|nr:hypothetical protein CFSAN002369_15800 [Clostridium botulinum CFSAN002369]
MAKIMIQGTASSVGKVL